MNRLDNLVSVASKPIVVTYFPYYGYWRISCAGWGSRLAFTIRDALDHRLEAHRYLTR
jgi:hypothetical protein